MKGLKRLTPLQKRAVSAAGYLPDNWKLERETEFYLKIVHGLTGARRTIDKYAIPKKGREKMNIEAVTIQDCIDNLRFGGRVAVINDGKLVRFQKEETPTQTANPSGDE